MKTETSDAIQPKAARIRGSGRIFKRERSPYWQAGYYKPGVEGRGSEQREAARDLRTNKKLLATPENRVAAEKFLRARVSQIEEQKNGGRPFIGPRGERLKVWQLVDWVQSDLTRRGKDSQQNFSNLKRVRRDFGSQRAMTIREEQLDKYVERRLADGAAPATINRTLQLLGQCFGLAIERRRLADKPVIPHLPEKNARKGFFEYSEFSAVLENLPEYLKDFCRFSYQTGWRKGEASSLRWNDIEGDTIRLRAENSKNGRARSVEIEGELADVISRRRVARVVKKRDTVMLSEFVFHRDGLPIGDIRKSWQRACCLAGVGRMICRKCGETVDAERKCPKCGTTWQQEQLGYVGKLWHDFRRTAVRDMVRAGVSEVVARSISGHVTRAVFDRYDITDASDQREALKATQLYRQQRAEQQASARIN